MRKSVVLLAVMLVVLSVSVAAAKPVKEECTTIKDGVLKYGEIDVIPMGFISDGSAYDGYNYQARLFNGLYGEDKLVMKWSDTWLSNKDCNGDRKLDRGYACDPVNAASSACPGAWVTNHFLGSYVSTTLYHWDVSGTWMLDFAGGDDNRQFVDLVQDADGNVVGEFWYLSGGDWLYGGPLIGMVTGDDLHLYYNRTTGYEGDFYGTIGEDVITDGTFTDNKGNVDLPWTAVGTSEKIYETCYWNEFIKIVAAPEDAYVDGGVWYDDEGTPLGESIWGAYIITMDIYEDSCGGSYKVKEVKPGLGWGLWN